ncbi:M12 family metallo-peptidase [Pilimelia columellifera]|uniref:Uncharacterized protein n=1 Tax=Pilimelia columellifera subsp. columellifera TaxID=706583 RepID=A0ABP6AH59_9ACTN
MVLLVVDRSVCGIGWLNATAARGFSVVSTSCATGLYTVAHEMGHNQGAQHDPQTSPGTRPFPYGHGFKVEGKHRTVMSYACRTECQRVNYWSGPRSKFKGVTLGDKRTSDNARVLNETAGKIASFR